MLEKSPDMRGEVKIVDIDSLMPQEHLLRKIDKVINFEEIYDKTERYYSEDKGRPCCDPVVVVKIAFCSTFLGYVPYVKQSKRLKRISHIDGFCTTI